MENAISNTTAAERIGYFSVSMPTPDSDLIRLRHFMKAHRVYMQKSNQDPADDWWYFQLPNGTTKVRKEHRGAVPHYTICLPDGYCFVLEQGPLNRDGFFTTPPLVFIDIPEEG
jgi:hypothetical protein